MNKQEIALYSSVWVKADKEGEIKLDFKDKRLCYRARFALYNIKRQAREGKLASPELLRAVERCTIYLDKQDWSLTVSSQLHGQLNELVAQAIGMTSSSLPEIEEPLGGSQEIAESAKRLIEKLNEPAKPRVTPYYNRTGE